MEDVERNEGAEVNETGATGEAEAEVEESEEGGPEELENTEGASEQSDAVAPEKATYLITGLVDKFDEQHQITGQYPVGSEQELLVVEGDRAVEAGQATKVE